MLIQFDESLLHLIVKAIGADFNRFHPLTKDLVCTDDMHQAASGDNFINTTIIEGLPYNVRPLTKVFDELLDVARERNVQRLCQI